MRQIEDAQRRNAAWYDERQPPEQESPFRHHLARRRRYVQSALSSWLAERGQRKFSTLLDLGCGDGNNLAWLRNFADNIYGSDYNPLRLARARRAHDGVSVFLADILNYPSVDDAFDAIFFNHVIEHISDDLTALRTVHRILKPGGLLVLGTPNEGSWWWQIAYRRAPQTLATTDHVHFYTAKTIAEKMAAAGLEVLQTKHLGWGPPDWDWDMRLRRHKLIEMLFENVGQAIVPDQGASLYLLATKQK